MEIKTLHIIMLFMLAFLIAIIIGVMILFMVDRKLRNIKINIPEQKCPMPNFYIHTEKGKISKIDFSMYEDGNNVSNGNIIMKNDIKKRNEKNKDVKEGFDVVKSNETIEKPLPINDTNYIEISQGYSKIGSDMPNTGNNIRYPSHDDIMRYNDNGCYRGLNKQVRKVETQIKNENLCKKIPIENANNTYTTGMINASGEIVNHNVSYYIPNLYMDGYPGIRGIHYDTQSVESEADVDQIGSIPVNNYDGEPKPLGSFMS
jgi:hypothetical protein